jgi:glycosyltransferase involved in cell wall biosynthesis
MRVLWVVPRFGTGFVGGAEAHVRGLATRGMPEDWTAEIATTCAVDHETWQNVLPPGTSSEEGVLVRRFPVGPRDVGRFWELHTRIMSASASYADELEWLSHSVWSPNLERFVERERERYDLLVFSPYPLGTTVWGAQIAPERSALMPCLHDEPYARLATVRRIMERVRGCLFNAPAEERLARRLYSVADGQVVGMGYEAPERPPVAAFAEPRGLGRYVLCAGRLEEGKRVQVAVEYALRYASERKDAPRLVLLGRGSYRPPPEAAEIVVDAGFVSDEERRAAYAEAVALVNPSTLESLSLVLMECWLEGTPALVAAGSDVMREHCDLSGGGMAFDSYEDYREALDRLLADPPLRAEMGTAGQTYVLDTYNWPVVRGRFRDLAERLSA